MTSEVSSIENQDEYTWNQNKAGFLVSHFYGFGMINAYNLVQMAKKFESVPPMQTCVQEFTSVNNVTPKPKFDFYKNFILESDGCENTEHEVNYIEHVQLKVSIKNSQAGTADIRLRSPQGTLAYLMEYDVHNDQYGEEMHDWVFDSVITWAESPRGKWTATFSDESNSNIISGEVISLTLYVHGTKEPPKHYSMEDGGTRKYRSYMKSVPQSFNS